MGEAVQHDVDFAIVDVDTWELADTESSGGDEKQWLTDPDGARWLFKPRTEQDGWSQGEDWAEKIATHLAGLFGVPAARVELARRGDRYGSISCSLLPKGWELQHGALLLGAAIPGFETHNRARTGHTLDNIERVLEPVASPATHTLFTAFDVFAGYLLLDALVANQDRHEENWAVLRPLTQAGGDTLAGSYDHGSSLGFNLQDQRRSLLLERGGVDSFARKGRAQRFEQSTDGKLTLVELADRALGRSSAAARAHWHAGLDRLSEEVLQDTVDRVPELSAPSRRFTLELLKTNRRRLHHEY